MKSRAPVKEIKRKPLITNRKSKLRQAHNDVNSIIRRRIAKIQGLPPLIGRLFDLFWTIVTGEFLSEVYAVKKKIRESVFSHCVMYRGKQLPLLSIVIPTLNEVDWLRHCLLSLRHGGYPNYEVIVVDGFSTDGTADIAQQMGAKVVFSRSRSMSRLIQFGCLIAQGDIILKTDADTIFPRGILYAIAEVFAETPTAQIYNAGHLYYDAGLLTNLIAHYYDKYWRKPWKTSGHFIAFRKSALQLIHFREEMDGYEDFKFGDDAYQTFGSEGILYDPNIFVLISSRGIKKYGLIKHILGRSSSYKAAASRRFGY